jgi:large subunit ribosomal protein L17
MRHLKSTKKFKRTEEERTRLWKDLVNALIINGTILTFTARAKWFRPKFDRLVTLVKSAKGDTKLAFHKIRPFLSEKNARKLIEEIVPTLEGRNGGYTLQVKVFQEFSPHDKSIVKLVEPTASVKKVVPSDIATSDEVVDVAPKAKPVKKATPKTKKAPVAE